MSTHKDFLASAGKPGMQSAYLLVCAKPAVAKRLTNDFLMRLYCKKGGCGSCSVCLGVLEGSVDIMRLSAPKVAEFREAISFVFERPVGTVKTVIIEDADDISISAANSMLKTLEDPPPRTVFILQARSAAGVPPTVASRCAVMHIEPDVKAQAIIREYLGVDETTARVLAGLSGGYAEEAAILYEDKDFLGARDAAIDMCIELLYQKSNAISRHADLMESNKERLAALLCVMQVFFRDILVYQKTWNELLIQTADRKDDIIKAAADFTSGALSNIIRAILESERRFSFAVNFRLAAEKLLFDILEEKARWKK